MKRFFERVGRIVAGPRTKWITVIVWVILAAVFSTFAPAISTEENNNAAQLPNTAWSVQADHIAQKYWPTQNGIPALIVWHQNGGLTNQDLTNIQKLAKNIRQHPLVVQQSVEPLDQMPLQSIKAMESKDGTTLVQTVTFKAHTPDSVIQQDVQTLQKRIATITGVQGTAKDSLSASGLHVRITGPAGISADTLSLFGNVDVTLLIATVLLVLVLLILLYRSPLLAIIPLIGVGFAYAVISPVLGLLAKSGVIVVDPESVSIMTVLLFGAGTDYCLFLVARFRESLGSVQDRHQAMRGAIGGAGDAIAMSAVTVVVSLLTLLFAKSGSFHRFAVPFSLAILIMAIAGLTLVPALLSIFGRSSFYPFVPRTPEMIAERKAKNLKVSRKSQSAGSVGKFSRGLGQLVAKKPWPILGIGLVALGVLALFSLQTKETYDPLSSLPSTTASSQGFTLLEDHFSPGILAPVSVVVNTDGKHVDLQHALKSLPFVKNVASADVSTVNSDYEQVQVTLNENPFTLHAIGQLPTIRNAVQTAVTNAGISSPAAHYWVGGQTASLYDSKLYTHRDTHLIMPIVIAIIALLLLVYLRSLVAMLYLISTVVLSFFGALGAGWLFLHHFMGINALQGGVPLYAFIFLVALGEDYNIFMVSRIWQEAKKRPFREAISEGVSRTSSVITSAGLILAGTFSVLTGLPGDILLEFGVITAIGVLLDTFIVRPLVVPAITAVLGRFAFWPGKQHQTISK